MFGASKFNRVVQHPGYNILSALIGAVSSNKASKAATKAADASAKAQIEAAKIAADEARFRPIDMTNAFGSVNWLYDTPATQPMAPIPYMPIPTSSGPTSVAQFFKGGFDETTGAPYPQYYYPQQAPSQTTGRVTGVNLTPSAFVQGLSNDAQANYNNYQNLFSQYFNPNLQEGGNQIYQEWQNLLSPTRSTQQTNLFDTLQAKGITGIQGYDPLTGAAYNPMANSLFSSWAGADQQMAANSINEYLSRLGQLQAGVDTTRGSLVGINELPINNVLNVSAALGGRNANAQGSSALMQGLSGAAQTQAQGQVANAASKNSFWQGLGNSISGLDFSSFNMGGGTRTPVQDSIVYSGAPTSAFSGSFNTAPAYTSPLGQYQSGYGNLF